MINKKKKIIKIFLIILSIIAALAIVVFCYYFVGKAPIAKNIAWGVDFSQMQAESLGLNWKELYSAIINDLGAKNIKLHTQWDWVEGKKGNFYFNDIDWQIRQAEDNNVEIIYVLGIKTGRWPECHIPAWAENMSEEQVKLELSKYITQVVQRYKNSPSITYWQVENEPLFKFGQCPDWYYNDGKSLQEEVALVKSLDPTRKIIISDSGEQSSWFGVAKQADIVGITMYRKVWAHITDRIGFNVDSFLSPITYWRKALLIKKIFNKDVICIELQLEPWASRIFNDVPLSEQEKTMNPGLFDKNIEYAKATGLDKFYLWGVEWWYWMKTDQGRPAIWDKAKNLFN
jgi:hypothetical protein